MSYLYEFPIETTFEEDSPTNHGWLPEGSTQETR